MYKKEWRELEWGLENITLPSLEHNAMRVEQILGHLATKQPSLDMMETLGMIALDIEKNKEALDLWLAFISGGKHDEEK